MPDKKFNALQVKAHDAKIAGCTCGGSGEIAIGKTPHIGGQMITSVACPRCTSWSEKRDNLRWHEWITHDVTCQCEECFLHYTGRIHEPTNPTYSTPMSIRKALEDVGEFEGLLADIRERLGLYCQWFNNVGVNFNHVDVVNMFAEILMNPELLLQAATAYLEVRYGDNN